MAGRAGVVARDFNLGQTQWPQFRGPSGQGLASETGLPLEWSESRNVLWKTPVPGRGWSSPSISGGRVWLTTSVEGSEGRRRGLSLRRSLSTSPPGARS